MSSVYVVCWILLQTFQTYFCIPANSMDPDQTAPKVCKNDFKNHKQMTKQTTIVVTGALRVKFKLLVLYSRNGNACLVWTSFRKGNYYLRPLAKTTLMSASAPEALYDISWNWSNAVSRDCLTLYYKQVLAFQSKSCLRLAHIVC